MSEKKGLYSAFVWQARGLDLLCGAHRRSAQDGSDPKCPSPRSSHVARCALRRLRTMMSLSRHLPPSSLSNLASR